MSSINYCLIILLTRKYFCKKGYINYNFNWIKVYYLLRRFILIFKFSYNLKTKSMELKYIVDEKQLENKFHFFKLFIKLNKNLRWFFLDLNKVFYALHNIRKGCMRALISQL